MMSSIELFYVDNSFDYACIVTRRGHLKANNTTNESEVNGLGFIETVFEK